MGARVMCQLVLSVQQLAGQEALDKLPVLLHINEEQVDEVMRELWSYSFFGCVCVWGGDGGALHLTALQARGGKGFGAEGGGGSCEPRLAARTCCCAQLALPAHSWLLACLQPSLPNSRHVGARPAQLGLQARTCTHALSQRRGAC